jgi:hypothetical protein
MKGDDVGRPAGVENRIERRTVLRAMGGVSLAGLAGCLGDDGDDDPPDADGVDDGESGDGEDVADDAGDDATDDETAEGDDASDDSGDGSGDGDGDNGTAELTILGETYTSSGHRVGCYDEGTTLASTFETEFDVGVDLWVTFLDDHADIRSTVYTESQTADDYDGEEDREVYRAEVHRDELDFDIDEGGDSSYASGTVHLDPDNEPAEEANPDGTEVTFEIEC